MPTAAAPKTTAEKWALGPSFTADELAERDAIARVLDVLIGLCEAHAHWPGPAHVGSLRPSSHLGTFSDYWASQGIGSPPGA